MHHLTKFSVNSNLWRCYGNAFVKERLTTMFKFFLKEWHFLVEIVFLSIFSFKFEISELKLTHVQNFSQIRQKKRTLIDRENGLMTSYTRDGDDIIKTFMLLRDFVPKYHHAKFCGDWATNKGETSGRGGGIKCSPGLYFHKIAQLE